MHQPVSLCPQQQLSTAAIKYKYSSAFINSIALVQPQVVSNFKASV